MEGGTPPAPDVWEATAEIIGFRVRFEDEYFDLELFNAVNANAVADLTFPFTAQDLYYPALSNPTRQWPQSVLRWPLPFAAFESVMDMLRNGARPIILRVWGGAPSRLRCRLESQKDMFGDV